MAEKNHRQPSGFDVISYCMTIDACARSGDALRAATAARMEDAGTHATFACCATLNKSLAKLSEVPRIERILEQMRLAGPETSIVMYNTLIRACARHADTQRAEHWLRFMIENRLPTDVVSYSTVIHCCATSTDLHRAEFVGWIIVSCVPVGGLAISITP